MYHLNALSGAMKLDIIEFTGEDRKGWSIQAQ